MFTYIFDKGHNPSETCLLLGERYPPIIIPNTKIQSDHVHFLLISLALLLDLRDRSAKSISKLSSQLQSKKWPPNGH